MLNYRETESNERQKDGDDERAALFARVTAHSDFEEAGCLLGLTGVAFCRVASKSVALGGTATAPSKTIAFALRSLP